MIKARDLIELGKAKLKDEKIPNYKLDARILLSHILNLENNFLFSDVYVSDINQETYFKMIKDRVNGKPVSKIISKRISKQNIKHLKIKRLNINFKICNKV